MGFEPNASIPTITIWDRPRVHPARTFGPERYYVPPIIRPVTRWYFEYVRSVWRLRNRQCPPNHGSVFAVNKNRAETVCRPVVDSSYPIVFLKSPTTTVGWQ